MLFGNKAVPIRCIREEEEEEEEEENEEEVLINPIWYVNQNVFECYAYEWHTMAGTVDTYN